MKNLLYRLIFPRFLLLSVFGWDDLLMMAASTAMQAGAAKATQPSMNSTQFGATPEMSAQQEDPFAWVNQILQQREARAEKTHAPKPVSYPEDHQQY
jgi:hypothetical protein